VCAILGSKFTNLSTPPSGQLDVKLGQAHLTAYWYNIPNQT